MSVNFGRKEPTYDPRDALFASLRPKVKISLPKIPSVFGHANDYLGESWKMFANGNDGEVTSKYPAAQEGCGDCTIAGPFHEHMELNYNAKSIVPHFTADNAVYIYSKLSGYDGKTGANDNGLEVREVLRYRQKTGLKDADGKYHKIGPYVSVEAGNLEELYQALYLFECVGIGFEVPSSALRQFSRGEVWSVSVGSPEIVGGHYVPLMGHAGPGEIAFITWSKRAVMTEAFYKKYVDEVWAYISPEQISKVTGKSYEGFNSAQLNEYLTLVGSQVQGHV